MFDNIKPWYLSRTIIGVLVSVLAKSLTVWGYHLSPDLQGEIVTLALTAVGFAGDGLAVWGRVKATKAIGKPNGGTSAGGGPALAVMLLVATLAGPLAACATPSADSTQQQAYALEADYQTAQRAVLAYVQSEAADPAVVAHLREAEAAVYATVVAVRAEAAALRRAPPGSREAERKRMALAAALAAGREGLTILTRHLNQGETR